MSGGGADPFSGTTTRNLLQHIISPKVVSDGASGYAVKTDLINIDSSYANTVNAYTPSGFQIVNSSTGLQEVRLVNNGSTTFFQSTDPIKFTQIGTANANTSLSISTFGSDNDVLTVGGDVVASNIYSAGYLPPSAGLIAGIGTGTPINIQESVTGGTGVALIQAGPSLGTNPSSTNGIARIAFNTDTNTNKTSVSVQPNDGTSANTVLTIDDGSVTSLVPYTVNIDATNSGTPHYIFNNSAGVNRWKIGLQTAESGGNAGADLYIYAYDDNAVFLTSPIQITRATGLVSTPGGFTGKSKGIATLVAGTVTVNNVNVTADSDILLTIKTIGGTGTGNAYVSAKVASTSFTITSVAGAGDTSTFNYIILN